MELFRLGGEREGGAPPDDEKARGTVAAAGDDDVTDNIRSPSLRLSINSLSTI